MIPCPKPKRLPESAVKVLPDGREICHKQASGRAEYKRRLYEMGKRQGWRCGLCGLGMTYSTSTFDHEHGRGMGGAKRDDRIEVDGRWQNAAVHWTCNAAKGSKSIPYVIVQPCPAK